MSSLVLAQVPLAVSAITKVAKLQEKKADSDDNGKKLELDFEQNGNQHKLYIEYLLFNIPSKTRTAARNLVLPNEIYRKGQSICLITRTKFAQEQAKLADDSEAKIKVDRLVDITWCSKNLVPYQRRREFVHSYDIFLVEEAIYSMVMDFIGKTLLDSSKPVCLISQASKAAVEKAKRTALINISSGIRCCSHIGFLDFDENGELKNSKEIEENIIEADKIICQILQGGAKNIRTATLIVGKGSAMPVPLYVNYLEGAERIVPEAPLFKPNPLNKIISETRKAFIDEGLVAEEEEVEDEKNDDDTEEEEGNNEPNALAEAEKNALKPLVGNAETIIQKQMNKERSSKRRTVHKK